MSFSSWRCNKLAKVTDPEVLDKCMVLFCLLQVFIKATAGKKIYIRMYVMTQDHKVNKI